MSKETIKEFMARGGKITHCKDGQAKGSKLAFTHSASIFCKGRKKSTLKDANFYLRNCIA